jgi:MFS family permease
MKTMTGNQLWNKNYCKVMVANFSLFFAFYVLTPLLPLYLSEHFGATKDVIGLVLSGYTVTALVMRPFSGFMVDSFPRKTVLMVSFVAFSIFFAGYLAASSLLLFTIVRTLHGAPFGALTVANSTVAIDVLPSSRRTEGIGYYGLSNNLAMAIAPTIGIFVYRYTHSFELLFWIALVVACAGMMVDGSLPPSPSNRRGSSTADKASPSRGRLVGADRFFLIRGWLLGVNTAKPSFATHAILEKFGIKRLFGNAIVAGGDCPEMKPSALPLRECAARMRGHRLSSHDWMVGDNWTDVKCAENACIKSAFCTYGFGRLADARCTVRISRIEELLRYLKGED